MRSRLTFSATQRYSSTRQRLNSTPKRRSKLRLPIIRFLFVALVLCIGYRQIQNHILRPEAVLVLGGAPEREVFAAEFARRHADLPIWVSSGSNVEYSQWVFTEAGITPDRLHLDYRAEDTVTNFTTLVSDLQTQGIQNIYLITSDYHMRRAQVIGEIVLGSRGIGLRPVPVPSGRSPESIGKVLRDGARAVLWVTTGRTGATVGRFLSHR